MDRWKYLHVLHAAHRLLNPLDDAKVDELVSLIRLGPGSRVLDMACGKAEVLSRMLRRWPASGIGVEISPYFVRDARANLARSGVEARAEIVELDGARFEAEPESFDAAICLGASWIFGGHRRTLGALARWTRPGGFVLAGEPFWRGTPSPEHLAAARLEPDSFGSHLDNIEAGAEAGLLFLHAIVSSPDDWDRYEGYHRYSVEMYLADHPGDPDAGELARSVRPARDDVYLRWGREELGWAAYLFSKPRS
jgi:SAM-dependent methyltransferase